MIEKRFPAPQLTNSKFNEDVNKCSEVFSRKYKSVMRMLEAENFNSPSFEEEIKSSVDNLKKIFDKLDSLHEELLISISKSGDEDLENLLEDREDW